MHWLLARFTKLKILQTLAFIRKLIDSQVSMDTSLCFYMNLNPPLVMTHSTLEELKLDGTTIYWENFLLSDNTNHMICSSKIALYNSLLSQSY